MKKTLSLITGVAIMSLGVAYLAIAWTEPASAPPESNIPAPLNTSINAQSKEGALVIGTNSGLTTGLVVQYGNVGIGTTDPGAKLEVEGNIIADVPTTDTHVATKGYVDAQASSGGGYSMCYYDTSLVDSATCEEGYDMVLSTLGTSCSVTSLLERIHFLGDWDYRVWVSTNQTCAGATASGLRYECLQIDRGEGDILNIQAPNCYYSDGYNPPYYKPGGIFLCCK